MCPPFSCATMGPLGRERRRRDEPFVHGRAGDSGLDRGPLPKQPVGCHHAVSHQPGGRRDDLDRPWGAHPSVSPGTAGNGPAGAAGPAAELAGVQFAAEKHGRPHSPLRPKHSGRTFDSAPRRPIVSLGPHLGLLRRGDRAFLVPLEGEMASPDFGGAHCLFQAVSVRSFSHGRTGRPGRGRVLRLAGRGTLAEMDRPPLAGKRSQTRMKSMIPPNQAPHCPDGACLVCTAGCLIVLNVQRGRLSLLYFRFGFLLILNNLMKSSNREVSVGANIIHFPS